VPRLPCRSNSAHGQEGEVPSTLRPRGFGQVSTLHFRYAEAFSPLPDAYETLLLDVLLGDQTLFVRADKVWITCATCSTMRALWMMSTAANAGGCQYAVPMPHLHRTVAASRAPSKS